MRDHYRPLAFVRSAFDLSRSFQRGTWVAMYFTPWALCGVLFIGGWGFQEGRAKKDDLVRTSRIEIVDPDSGRLVATLGFDKLSGSARLVIVDTKDKMVVQLRAGLSADRISFVGRLDVADPSGSQAAVSVLPGISGNLVRFKADGSVAHQWP